MFKFFTLCSYLFLMFVQPVYSEEMMHRQLAEKLLNLMNVQQNIEKSFEVIKQMQMSQFNTVDLPEGDSEKIQSLQNELMDMISKELNWDKIKEDYVQIYSQTFTEEELKGIIQFYESPVGQRFVEKTPELMNKSVELSQKTMKEMVPKIQNMTREFLEKRKNLPVNPP